MSQIFTDTAAWEEPPTEYTDITEPTAENILPQISHIHTDANNAAIRSLTSVRSVKSVGGSHSLIRAIRVRSSQGYVFGLRGYGRDAIPSYISFRLIR